MGIAAAYAASAAGIATTTAGIAAIGVGTAAATASYQQSKQQSEYQGMIAKMNSERNNAAVTSQLKQSYSQSAVQQQEAMEEASGAAETNYLDTLKAADTQKVASGAKGIIGASADAMVGDILGRGGYNQRNITRSLASAQRQMGAQNYAAYQSAQAGMTSPQVYKPSSGQMMFNAALQGAQSGLGVYSAGQQIKGAKK